MVTNKDLANIVRDVQNSGSKGPFVTEKEFSSGKSGGKGTVVRTGGGGGGGGSSGSSGSTSSYTSDLLPGQSYTSQSELNAAITQMQQQQAAESSRRQAAQQQRQSIIGRQTGIVQVGKDTPEVYQQEGIISGVKTTTLPQVGVRGYLREFRQNPKSIPGTISGAAKRRYAAAKAGVDKLTDKAGREKVVEQQTRDLQSGTRQTSFVQSGRGTIVTTNQPYSNVEIEKLGESGKISEQAVLNELGRRENERYGSARQSYIDSKLPEIQSAAQAELDQTASSLQGRVNRNEISLDQANKILESKTQELNKRIDTNVQDIAKQWHQQTGIKMQRDSNIYLNKVSDKIKLTKTISLSPLIVGAGVATGFVGAAIAGSSTAGATAVGAAGVIGTEAAVVTTGYTVYSSAKEGTLNPTRVASILLPQILFAGGAAAGARGFSRPTAESAKIDAALKTSTIKPTGKATILTTEKQINALEITGPQKTELINQLRMGNRVGVQRFKIDNTNPQYRAAIDKAIPRREIIRVGNYDAANGKIVGKDITKISLGGDRFNYLELQTGTSAGVYNSQGQAVLDTVTTRLTKTSGKIQKTRSGIQVTQEPILEPTTNQVIGRKVKAQAITYEGLTKEFSPRSKATYKDLLEVAESEKFNRFPSTKSSQSETQKIIELQREITKLGDNEFLDVATVKLKTQNVRGKAERLPGPISFSKKMKPLTGFDSSPKISPKQAKTLKKMNKATSVDYKAFEGEFPSYTGGGKGEGGGPSLYKQVSQELNARAFARGNIITEETAMNPPGDFSGQILKAVREGGRIVSPTKMTSTRPQLLPSRNLDVLTKKTNSQININQLNSNKLIERERQKVDEQLKALNFQTLSSDSIVKTRGGQGSRVVSGQISASKQITQQIEKLSQSQVSSNYNITPRAPPLPTPLLPFFDLPALRGGGFDKEIKKLKRKKGRRIAGYTASLAAAAVQAQPVKVTRAQYEKLKKRVYTGIEARPVLQIVDFKNSKRKGVNAVDFGF